MAALCSAAVLKAARSWDSTCIAVSRHDAQLQPLLVTDMEDRGSRRGDVGEAWEVVVARAMVSPTNTGSLAAVTEALDGNGGWVGGITWACFCSQMEKKSFVNW